MEYFTLFLFALIVFLISSAPLSSVFAIRSSLISTNNAGHITTVQGTIPNGTTGQQQSQNSNVDATSQGSGGGFPGNWTVPIPWSGTIWNLLGPSNTRNLPTQSTVPGAICSGIQGGDVDGDAICDKWETSDPVINPLNDATHRFITCPQTSPPSVFMDTPQCNNGSAKYDLCITDAFSDVWGGVPNQRVCPKVGHKDIYVEIDYMTGHRPDNNAIRDVIKAFGNSPVTTNTVTDHFNNLNGITLHVVIDEEILPYVTPINAWKDPPSSSCAGRPPGEDCDDNNDFKHIKHGSDASSTDGRFGSPSERALGAMILDMKHYVYHYATFIVNWQGDPLTPCGPSGTAETLGNDLIVSLGCNFNGGPDGHVPAHTIGSKEEQAGTFMHELGHNLNLGHGGPALSSFGTPNYNTNCKPNELSVMSWSRQIPSFISAANWVNYKFLDYSRSAVKTLSGTDLNEAALVESLGLAVTPPSIIIYGTPSTPPVIRPATLPSGGGLINWDGGVSGGPDTVSVDINNLGLDPQCVAVPGQTHKSMDEWNNLQYYFLNDWDGQDGLTNPAVPPEIELTGEMVQNLTKIGKQFSGLLDPINANGSSTFIRGDNIPVKFQLRDATGKFMTDANISFTAERKNGSLPNTTLLSSYPSSQFGYNNSTNTYLFNWPTVDLQDGIWGIRAILNITSTNKQSLLQGPPPIPSGISGMLIIKP